MTGKFDRETALRAMNRAAGIFILSLRDMGGETPDDPAFYQIWGQASGLPSGESFGILKGVLVDLEWIYRVDRPEGFFLTITQKGEEKAEGFAQHLTPEKAGEDGA
jgi:hypothetical protein